MNTITQSKSTIGAIAVSVGGRFGHDLPRPVGDTSNNSSEPPM